MSWFKESERHAKARLGIKTSGLHEVKPPSRDASPEQKEVVQGDLNAAYAEAMAEQQAEQAPSGPVSKQKLAGVDNSLQTHVHSFGHIVRRAERRRNIGSEEIAELVSEYDQARLRALEYYGAQGSLPYWSGKDWVGKENWHDGGQVKQLLDRVTAAKGDQQLVALSELSRAVNKFGM